MFWADKQVTKEQAIRIGESGVLETCSDETIVKFQLFQHLLCMDFGRFHQAVEKVLGRPVWSHEFANHEAIVSEYLGEKEPPTMEEIINMIPEEKRIILEI